MIILRYPWCNTLERNYRHVGPSCVALLTCERSHPAVASIVRAKTSDTNSTNRIIFIDLHACCRAFLERQFYVFVILRYPILLTEITGTLTQAALRSQLVRESSPVATSIVQTKTNNSEKLIIFIVLHAAVHSWSGIPSSVRFFSRRIRSTDRKLAILYRSACRMLKQTYSYHVQ